MVFIAMAFVELWAWNSMREVYSEQRNNVHRNFLHSMTSVFFGRVRITYGTSWNFYGTLRSGKNSGSLRNFTLSMTKRNTKVNSQNVYRMQANSRATKWHVGFNAHNYSLIAVNAQRTVVVFDGKLALWRWALHRQPIALQCKHNCSEHSKSLFSCKIIIDQIFTKLLDLLIAAVESWDFWLAQKHCKVPQA